MTPNDVCLLKNLCDLHLLVDQTLMCLSVYFGSKTSTAQQAVDFNVQPRIFLSVCMD